MKYSRIGDLESRSAISARVDSWNPGKLRLILDFADHVTKSKGCILIVDDDPIVLAQLEDRVSALGYEVATRDRALGTAAWIKKHDPVLVLLDINMPALSGTELLTILERQGLSTPVVFCSGAKPREVEAATKRTGALGWIPKGLPDRQFARELTRLLRAAGSS